jgi:hypothetical protein
MLGLAKSVAKTVIENCKLPQAAKRERRRDRQGRPEQAPSIEAVIEACVAWLGEAQDRSASKDGGVARDYSLVDGWSTSYPETTGYIVTTMIDYAEMSGTDATRERARRMLDWLVSIQLPGGGFQGGRIDSEPVVPVTFNTGQILIGLARGEKEFGGYRESMHRAANWLTETLDDDGCWRKHPTPFAHAGEKAYETHVAWGLFEAARLEPHEPWGDAGLANVRWSLGKQRENGWVEDCNLSDPSRPLTHTLGYFLRGLLEAYRFSGDEDLLTAAGRTADGLLGALSSDGSLPGRLDRNWSASAPWVCLTGCVQIAHCWLLLHGWTGDERYRRAAEAANHFVRTTIRVDGPPEIRGGVKGSFPVDGDYGRFEYLNWAAKFCADSHMAQRRLNCGDSI